MTIYRFINTVILFNFCYWGLYFLIGIFYNIGKIELLFSYLIIGLIVGLLTTRENRSDQAAMLKVAGLPAEQARTFIQRKKKWTKLMDKLEGTSPRYIIVFTRMMSWPIGLVVTIKNSFKK